MFPCQSGTWKQDFKNVLKCLFESNMIFFSGIEAATVPFLAKIYLFQNVILSDSLCGEGFVYGPG